MNVPCDLVLVFLSLCAACIAGCHLPLGRPVVHTVCAAFGVVLGVIAFALALVC